jgi:hypothetical protein
MGATFTSKSLVDIFCAVFIPFCLFITEKFIFIIAHDVIKCFYMRKMECRVVFVGIVKAPLKNVAFALMP